jgi:hypothetical protein
MQETPFNPERGFVSSERFPAGNPFNPYKKEEIVIINESPCLTGAKPPGL